MCMSVVALSVFVPNTHMTCLNFITQIGIHGGHVHHPNIIFPEAAHDDIHVFRVKQFKNREYSAKVDFEKDLRPCGRMTKPRGGHASLVVYHTIFITGGYTTQNFVTGITNTCEVINLVWNHFFQEEKFL